jgi:O-antigen ligase
MKIINKLIKYGFYLFVFLLPWQTRWIYRGASLNGGVWEYGRLSLYGTEILLLVVLFFALLKFLVDYIKKIENKINDFKKELKGIKFLIILLIIWSALTIIWSQDKLLSWYGWLRFVEGVGLFWLISSQFLNINLRKTGLVLIFSGVIQSLIGAWQFLIQWSLGNKWLGMSLLDPAVFGVSVVDNGLGRFLRAHGSLPHPNMLAGYLVVCILVCLIIIIREKLLKIRRWLYLALVILSLGLFLTFSRAGWLALFFSLTVYWIYNIIKKVDLRKLFLTSLIIVLVFSFLTIIYFDLVITRLAGEQQLEIKSNQERISYYNQASLLIKDNWYKGTGLNNYTLALYQKNPSLNSWDYQPVHDIYLLTLAELGIIGLILFIGIIILAFKNESIYWPLLLAIIILGFFDHYSRSLYFGVMLWWLVIGLNKRKI